MNIEEPVINDEKAIIIENNGGKKTRSDNTAAVQAVLCLIIAAAIFILSHYHPDMAEEFIGLIRQLTADENEIIKNPIETVVSVIDRF